MKKWNKFVSLLSVFTLVVSLTACGTKETGSETATEGTEEAQADTGAVKILNMGALCFVPIHIAKQLQFFEAEGLEEGKDYELVEASGDTSEILGTGQADVAMNLLSAELAPISNGLEIKTVLGIHTGCIKIVAKADEDISSVADLKGKKIGVAQLASSAHVVAQRALEAAGVGATTENMEVNFEVFEEDALGLALQNGEVDAIAVEDPQATQLENEGIGKAIFDSATSDLLKDEYCCSLWATDDAIANKSEKLAKVVTAIQKASLWVEQNPDLAAKIQVDNEWIVGDYEIDKQVISNFSYYPSVSKVKEAVGRNAEALQKLGLLGEDVDVKELSDRAFYQLKGVEDEITGTIDPPIDPQTQVKTS